METATWTKEDIEKVEKLIEIKNRGYYASGTEVTDVYNRVLHKAAKPTSCGSCLRQRISELQTALKAFKKLSEESKAEEPTVTPQEENKEPEQPKKKPTGRKKKTE